MEAKKVKVSLVTYKGVEFEVPIGYDSLESFISVCRLNLKYLQSNSPNNKIAIQEYTDILDKYDRAKKLNIA